jgi:rod shape determining protein RodA
MGQLRLRRSPTLTQSGPFDWVLFLSMVVLIAFGVFTIYSTSFSENQFLGGLFQRQIVYAVAGIVLFFILSRLHYKIFAQTSGVLYFLAIGLLVLTFVWGISTRGSTRWIDLGWFRLQPSEIVKPVLVAVLALYYSTRDKLGLKEFTVGFLLAVIPGILIFRQPDLGSAIVVMGIWFIVTVVAGMPWRYLLSGGLLGVLVFPLFYNLLQDYQRSRLTSFLNPQTDPLGTGYNIIQAIIAVGSGQLTGRGFGRGTQSHLNFLPEQHTDFIFATLAEELGFLGSTLVLAVFLVLIIRMLMIARQAPDQFSLLLVCGIISMVVIQLFINVGMNLGLMPVTGITLPFISFGGSSLVAMIISLGLVEAVARARQSTAVEIK